MIRVVNFPFCNFYSLERFLRIRALPYEVIGRADELSPTDIILIPGVGTFGQGMAYLRSRSMDRLIRGHASSGGKVVGICLGMQILLQSSSESPGVEGLDLIPGTCERIPVSSSFSVPHIGWNEIRVHGKERELFTPCHQTSGLVASDYYFVHSYYAKPTHDEYVIASFKHPTGMLPAVIALNGVMGLQFHPEKSGPAGYALLDRILVQ